MVKLRFSSCSSLESYSNLITRISSFLFTPFRLFFCFSARDFSSPEKKFNTLLSKWLEGSFITRKSLERDWGRYSNIYLDMSVVEIPGGAAPTSGATGMGSSTASSTSSILGAANHSSFLSASSRALLEKLRANDAKRGAAGKWAEIKNGLFRVSAVGGGSGGAGGPQNVSSSSSAMLQRGQEDHKQVSFRL